jgi:hypothetical protein
MLRGLALIAIISLACAGTAPSDPGQTRLSDLGYAAVVPTGWFAIGKREYAGLEADMDSLLSSALNSPAAAPALAQARDNIRSGQVEFLLPEGKAPDSYDNVNVQVAKGRLPPLGADVSAVCDPMSGGLSAAFGRPVTVYRCELLRVASHTSLVIESDGFFESSRMIQYHLSRSPGKLLTVTGTFAKDTFESRSAAVDTFVRSIAFPQ